MKNRELRLDPIEQIIVQTALAHFINSGTAQRLEKPANRRVSLFAYTELSLRLSRRIIDNLTPNKEA